MYLSRDEKLTNDPRELYLIYKKLKDQNKVVRTWYKGDEDAEKLIKKFFYPEFFLKRLIIAYHKKLKSETQKSMSLLGFFLKLPAKIRLLNMVERKPIYKKKEEGRPSNLSRPNLQYESVQEIIEEFEFS